MGEKSGGKITDIRMFCLLEARGSKLRMSRRRDMKVLAN